MPDRKKVIKGIWQCWLPSNAEEIETQCVDCPYRYPDAPIDVCQSELREDAIALLKAQPEIVRCKDCKRRGTYDCPVYVGGDGMYSEPDDWFCADGERKETIIAEVDEKFMGDL